LKRFKDSADVATRDIYLTALFNCGCGLMTSGRLEDALHTFESLIQKAERLSPGHTPSLQASSLCNIGRILADMRRYDQAQATLVSLLERFKESSDASVQVCIAVAKEQLDLLGPHLKPGS
jgi:tetratricopeptide (TPR) repeat protein